MSLRAQGAIELLIILAMIAAAGLIIYSTSQNKFAESNKALIVSQARATVNDLSSAASEVYSEGVGAKRKVYIVIPEGVSNVSVNNTMINIRLKIEGQISDINTQTSMRLVQGSDFPTTPGGYWVNVVAKNGYVLIGSSNLSIVPQSISVEMTPSNSTSAVVTFTNMGSVPLNVTLSPQWTWNNTVNMSLNTTLNFALNTSGGINSTIYVLVNFTTYQNTTLQAYAGTINVATNSSETAQINVYVNVVGNQLPTGVSYITIDTFKDAGYSSPTTNFTLPYNVTINGSTWYYPGTVNLDIIGPSGSSVKTGSAAVNPDKTFIYNGFNPAGLPAGVYTIMASEEGAGLNASSSFNITACS